ncbi:hypothetical protein B5S29_g2131 [[Candida] boidinii]|nr:hypothetical protein B5S29_g2131 [[Candida] boidinii]
MNNIGNSEINNFNNNNNNNNDSDIINTAIQLVKALSDPSTSTNPHQLHQVQSTFQQLQKSPNGWNIANQLLLQHDLNCKFFGALTYTVNLNLHINSLKSAETENENENFHNNNNILTLDSVTIELINHFLNLIFNDSTISSNSMFVIRKIMTNFAFIYINNYNNWPNPILTTIGSIHSKQLLYSNELLKISKLNNNNDNEIKNVLLNFNDKNSIKILLIMSQIIVEEIMKKEINNIDKFNLHKSVYENLYPLTETILNFISESNELSNSPDLIENWFECFNSWIQYASIVEFDTTIRYDFKNLLNITISKFMINFNGNNHNSDSFLITTKAIETLIETLNTNPTFLNHDLKQILDDKLFGYWGQNYLLYLSQNYDFENSSQFGRLIISFLEIDLVLLSSKFANQSFDSKFEFLLNLTNYPGVPIEEESTSRDFVDFWSQLAETFVMDDDRISSILKNDTNLLSRLKTKSLEFFTKIAEIYWIKIHIPEIESDLDSYMDEFKIFRRDVSDLYEAIYPITKSTLLKDLVNNLSVNISSNSPRDCEASLFLISSLSDTVTENSVDDETLNYIKKIFDSNILDYVTTTATNNNTNRKFNMLSYTTIRFLSSVNFIYKLQIGSPYLQSVLNFLFNSMIGSTSYQLIASKTIAKICDESRSNLISFLPNFKNIITAMIDDITVDTLIRQRIINSYASIIQGVKDPVVQGENLLYVSELIEKRATEAISKLNENNDENNDRIIEYLTSLLSCLNSIGKGMQLPDEVEECLTDEEEKTLSDFWHQDPLNIHPKLLNLINIFTSSHPLLISNLGITEEAVNTLQCGLTESIPGPFVFNNDSILQFIITKFENQQTGKISYSLLFGLLNSLITSNYRDFDEFIISKLLNQIFFNKLNVIKDDPDLEQSSISIFSTILIKSPNLILSNPDNQLETILEFSLNLLTKNEKFVIKSSELFWTRLITLRKGSKNDTLIVSNLFNETQLGYILTYTTLNSMILTQRSNIDNFIEIIKNLISKYTLNSKNWLTDSILKINQERSSKNLKIIENSDILIKKLILTRGNRNCNSILKDFWLQINNLIDYNKK